MDSKPLSVVDRTKHWIRGSITLRIITIPYIYHLETDDGNLLERTGHA